MDKIDQKIFKELDSNPRMPVTLLAKKLSISQQVADYRLKRMLDQKIITKFATVINLKSLGLEQYRIFFNFNAKKDLTNAQIFTYLKKQSGIYWAARIGGRYDLHIVLLVRSFEEVDSFMDNFNEAFPGLIKDHKSCYVLNHLIYRHKSHSEDYTAIEYGYNDKRKEIDELDAYILCKIKDNCRLSALELSKGKNISYKTIINRIRKLEEEKIILGYRTFVKAVEQKPFIVLVSFKDYSRKKEKEVISYLARKKEVTQTLRLFGIWNLYLHVRIEDNEKLQNLIIDLRDKYDIIDNYEIIPVFEDIAIDLLPV